MAGTTFIAHFLGPDTHANRPSATGLPDGVMYACTTHSKIERVVSGAWADYYSFTGGTGVAADTIWDTKGDLVVASGADTAAKLAVGSNNQVLTADSAQTLGVKWATPSGGGVTELAYVEFTSNVTVSATTEASPTAVVSAGAVTYTAVKICIEFFTPYLSIPGAGNNCDLVLQDGGSSIGRFSAENAAAPNAGPPVLVRRFLTPSAGSHTYSIAAYRGSANVTVCGGAGGTGNRMPGYIRITSGG